MSRNIGLPASFWRLVNTPAPPRSRWDRFSGWARYQWRRVVDFGTIVLFAIALTVVLNGTGWIEDVLRLLGVIQ